MPPCKKNDGISKELQHRGKIVIYILDKQQQISDPMIDN